MEPIDRYYRRLKRFMPRASEVSDESMRAHAEYMAQIRRSIPWQKEIPEDIFETYALPMHVNDEPVVPCAKLFGKRLLPLIEGLSLRESALAVNYWCTENVAYRFNDAPTADALTVFKRGHGRCGEETVFAALALRSVGIPARQVYARRWSHCDDNHAWVEVYADGGWHYMGACEAEPVLDRGWFTNAASKAMLICCQADAELVGDEVISAYGKRMLLNVTPNYADCVTLEVSASVRSGHVAGARIDIQIANYCSFQTVASVVTGSDGCARIRLGKGTVYLFAASGTGFTFAEVNTNTVDQVELRLDCPIADGAYRFTQAVPAGRAAKEPFVYTPADIERARTAAMAYRHAHPPVDCEAWAYPPPDEITGECRLKCNLSFKPENRVNIGIERFENGAFRQLDLRGRDFSALALPAGRYRINACARQIDGVLSINSSVVTLCRSGLEARLDLPPLQFGGKLYSYQMPEPFNRQCAIICFAEDDSEPVQHIKNELKNCRALMDGMGIEAVIVNVGRIPGANTLLRRIRTGLNVGDERLPLTAAVYRGLGLFAYANYHVGAVKNLMEIIKAVR